MATNKQVLAQLSKPQRAVVKVLSDSENWAEASAGCPDKERGTCEITGKNCKFSNCPKMRVVE